MMIKWPRMASKIPEGTRGSAKIEHFTVSPADASRSKLRALLNNRSHMMLCPGRHARLLVDGELVMSDTMMEKDSNRRLIEKARGHVLIGGLGLGMVIWPLLAKRPRLHSLLVLEKNPDVIALVAPHLPKDSRLVIVEVDVFRWSPPRIRRFDTIYFDIWPDICKTNIGEAAGLWERARAWKTPGGWIGDWDTEVRRLEERSFRKENTIDTSFELI